MNDSHTIEQILALKASLGHELLILTHHYQIKEIVDLGDFVGDSFGLSQQAAANKSARFIIFCGVHFMAESAAILSQPHQTIQIPNDKAGCWMADMAKNHTVKKAWKELISITGSDTVIPITYMNSDAKLKAFCGKQGGTVCTSSNAQAAFKWGFRQREKAFFFPDQHLGRNIANQMGINPEEILVWNPKKPYGGHTPKRIKDAKLILWDGYCLVHTNFQVEHIYRIKKVFPHAKIIVHPECTQEVVDLADAVGSTSYIVKYVEEAPPKSTIVVGTEVNLIRRLALENLDKSILDLSYSLCPNMFKINLKNLLWTLENIGKVNVVTVPEKIKTDSRMALNRMLAIAA